MRGMFQSYFARQTNCQQSGMQADWLTNILILWASIYELFKGMCSISCDCDIIYSLNVSLLFLCYEIKNSNTGTQLHIVYFVFFPNILTFFSLFNASVEELCVAMTMSIFPKKITSLYIGPILDDRLKEKLLKPWKGAHSSHFRVCVSFRMRTTELLT